VIAPFVEGESLRDRCIGEAAPDPGRGADRHRGAGALDYAHRTGSSTGDIKPENILLHDGRALVADFGIALAAEQRRRPDDRDRDVAWARRTT
jgi:serine/threonine-protein kinase